MCIYIYLTIYYNNKYSIYSVQDLFVHYIRGEWSICLLTGPALTGMYIFYCSFGWTHVFEAFIHSLSFLLIEPVITL